MIERFCDEWLARILELFVALHYKTAIIFKMLHCELFSHLLDTHSNWVCWCTQIMNNLVHKDSFVVLPIIGCSHRKDSLSRTLNWYRVVANGAKSSHPPLFFSWAWTKIRCIFVCLTPEIIREQIRFILAIFNECLRVVGERFNNWEALQAYALWA